MYTNLTQSCLFLHDVCDCRTLGIQTLIISGQLVWCFFLGENVNCSYQPIIPQGLAYHHACLMAICQTSWNWSTYGAFLIKFLVFFCCLLEVPVGQSRRAFHFTQQFQIWFAASYCIKVFPIWYWDFWFLKKWPEKNNSRALNDVESC